MIKQSCVLVSFLILLVQCRTATKTVTAESKRPNILFCIADDASFPHMSAYGTTWIKTPAFDRVAREGILFTNAYTPNSKCSPSRACVLTGRNSWQLEEAANHAPFFPQKFGTYAEELAAGGYQVGFTGKGWAPGDPGKREGQPRRLTGISYNSFKIEAPTSGISGTDYAANFEAFLKAKPDGQPFCFWYGGIEPHRAYAYGTGVGKGGKKLSDIDRVPPFWMDNDTVRNDLLDYAYELEYFDGHLQKMLDMLEQRGELDNTIIVVTSDNGMPFPRVKGQAYEYSNHLPLAVMWKKGIKNPGRKVQDLVSFIDFAPTFLQVAGIIPTGMQPVQGTSLTDIFTSPKDGLVNPKRDHVLLGQERHDVGRPHDQGYPIRGMVKGNYLYLRNYEPSRWPTCNPETGYLNCDGSPTKTVILNDWRKGENTNYWQWSFGKRGAEELYQIDKDPFCLTNLAENQAFTSLKEDYRNQMEKELKAQQDPRMLGQGSVFDQYIYSQDAVRNFYERYMAGEKIKAGWVNETDFEKKVK